MYSFIFKQGFYRLLEGALHFNEVIYRTPWYESEALEVAASIQGIRMKFNMFKDSTGPSKINVSDGVYPSCRTLYVSLDQ